MRILSRAIPAPTTPVAVLGRDLVPGQMCWYGGILKSPRELELVTGHEVVLGLASDHEYGGTLQAVNLGGVYTPPWIIRCRAARIRLGGAAACDQEVVETHAVET